MNQEGPDLISLMHHLGACPYDFQQPPRGQEKEGIETAALVRDLLRQIALNPLSKTAESPVKLDDRERSLLSAQIACWLFSHAWFKKKEALIPDIIRFFEEVLPDLSPQVDPESWLSDMERREEFCRAALLACNYYPLGENRKQALERYDSISTLKRKKILTQTAAAYQRMKDIRKQMAEKAAREAANVYGRE